MKEIFCPEILAITKLKLFIFSSNIQNQYVTYRMILSLLRKLKKYHRVIEENVHDKEDIQLCKEVLLHNIH